MKLIRDRECIDEVLKLSVNKIQLPRGMFGTRGAWGFPLFAMLGSGTVLRGKPNGSLIHLENPTEQIPGNGACTYYEMLTAGGPNLHSNGVVVEEVMLTTMGEAKPAKMLHAWGSDFTARRVKVLGVNGDLNVTEGEGFGILVNSARNTTTGGGHLVEDCEVRIDPGAYACGIYVGVHDFNQAWSRVVRCRVSCEDGQTGIGFGVNSRTVIEDCEAEGVTRAIFSDTGSGEDVRIVRFRANRCAIGVEFRITNPETHRRRILVEDSDFVCTASHGGYVAGLVLSRDRNIPPDGFRVRDIEFRRCRFFNESGQPGHVGSSQFEPDGRQPRFLGCEFLGAWDRSQADAAKWTLEGCSFR
jgi:hypothetical protein